MFCPECGATLEDGSKFCGSCGASIDVNSQPQVQAVNQAAPPVSQPNFQAQGQPPMPPKQRGRFATWLSKSGKNKAIFFGGLGLIVVAGIVALVVFSCVSDQDKMKNLIMQTRIMKDGVISQRYTSYTTYKVEEFKITFTSDTSSGNNSTNKYCEFETTIQNDAFKSDIKANCNFLVDSRGNFTLSNDPQVMEKNTVPLTGVTDIEYKSGSDSSKDYEFNIIDFNSDFAESGDTYTSTASENVEFKYWFGTDKGTVTQTFKFSQDSGWKTEGKQEIANKTTVYSLTSKSFVYSYTGSSNYDVNKKSVLTFKDSGQPNVMAADYSVYREAKKKTSTYDSSTYYEINKTGSFTATPTHDFGTTDFKVTFSDGTVTFKISKVSSKTNNNTDELKHTLSVSLSTELVYESYSTRTYKYSDSFTMEEQ